MTITVYEREELVLSAAPGAGRLHLAHKHLLARLEPSLPGGTLFWTSKGVRFGTYCGVIRLGGETLEILPKLHRDEYAVARNKTALMNMLRHSTQTPWLESWQGGFDWQREHLLEIFIRKFCEDLRHALAGGLARAYRETVEELPVLRGRMDVSDHLRRPPATRHRMLCRFDEFDEDIPLNRVFRHCLERVSGLVRSPGLQREIEELRFQFADVPAVRFHPNHIKTIQLGRNLARFQSAWEQCCRILRGLYPDAAAGDHSYASLLFNMEALFEEAVYRTLRRELRPQGIECRFQGPQQSLIRDEQGSNPKRRMRPDITLTTPTGRKIILDCKWKSLGTQVDVTYEVSLGDLYQLHTYATEYQADAVGIVYPWLPGLPEEPRLLRFNTIGVPVWLVFVKMETFESNAAQRISQKWAEFLEPG